MISKNRVIVACTPATVVSRSSVMSLIITFMFEPAKLQMNWARASGARNLRMETARERIRARGVPQRSGHAGSPQPGDARSPVNVEPVRMAQSPPRLTELPDKELKKLLDLLKGSDSAELKLTVPEEHQRSTVSALGMDPLEAQIRQVFFFDTPDLTLNEQGVVVRARRVQGRPDDSVVKLRPVVPGELPADVRASKTMVVEVDAMPGGYVCSASMKGAGSGEVRKVLAGEQPIRKLFSKAQRSFYEAHAPDGLGLDDLEILGPIFVLKLKMKRQGFPGGKLVAELWLYPDGTRILELSGKCPPSQMFQVAIESRAYLASQGVDLSGEQQTKTRTALEFFSTSATEA